MVRRVVILEGRVEVIEDEAQALGPRDVRVRVRAAALNGADARLVRERGTELALPGIEVAGEITSMGDQVTRWQPGDHVMGLAAGGSLGELVTVDERLLAARPNGGTWEVSGSYCEAFTTAHDALTAARLSAGERVLISGAAGGVGLAGVQVALSRGAEVVGTVRGDRQREVVASLFPDATFTAPGEEHVAGPFDVVLELVGGTNFPRNIDLLGVEGRIVVVGRSSGAIAQIDLSELMARRGILTGRTLRHRTLDQKHDALTAMLSEMGDPGGRWTRVVIDSIFDLSDAAAAFDRFLEGGKVGKVVILMPDNARLEY